MNPWLKIPLEDYEAHMSMPSIAQAQYLAQVLDKTVQDVQPASVAVIGCAGGNGFEQLSQSLVKRVVAIDINPHYIEAVRERYKNNFDQLELLCGDVLTLDYTSEPVDLVFTSLVFEYIDYRSGLSSIKKFIKLGGYLSVILQLPNDTISDVSPSPYPSLSVLNNFIKLVPVEDFETYAKSIGLSVVTGSRSVLDSNKVFHEFLFRKEL